MAGADIASVGLCLCTNGGSNFISVDKQVDIAVSRKQTAFRRYSEKLRWILAVRRERRASPSHERWFEAVLLTQTNRTTTKVVVLFVVGGGGFEPPKSETSDLQGFPYPLKHINFE